MTTRKNIGRLALAVALAGNFAAPLAAQKSAAPAQTPSQAAPATPAADGLVATVDGQPITRSQLAALCLERYGENVLSNVLNKKLILQACEAKGVRITQKDVDDEIERTAGKFRLSTNLFLKVISEQRDITPEQYAADIIWPMLALRSLARDMIVVSDEDLNQAIRTEFGEKVQVRMIAVQDAALAGGLHAQVTANPEAFKQLAKEHSQDPSSASVEGLLPPIRQTSAADPIEQHAFQLQPNQISPVFTIADTHVILQCVRRIPPTELNAEQIAALGEQMRAELADQKLQQQAETVFETLREKSQVQVIFNDPALAKQQPGVAATINGQPIALSVLENECIKRYGPSVLEVEINRKILTAATQAAGIAVEQADIDAEVARAADYYGFIKDGKPDIHAWMERVVAESDVTAEVYLRDVVWPTVALKKLVADSVTITDADVQEAFEYDYGPRAEVLAIVCSNQRVAQEVWQMARDNPSEAFFGELAAQYSVEPTSRANYGKVPAIRAHGAQPTLEKVAFQLQPGELSGIIESAGQYIIIKGQGRTQPYVTDINAVRGELMKDITERKLQEAMHDKLTDLVASASIDNFLKPKSQLGRTAMERTLQELEKAPVR